MSHNIRTIKYLVLCLLCCIALTSCGSGAEEGQPSGISMNDLKSTGTMQLDYATEFQVEYYGDDYALVTAGEDQFIVCEENAPVPENLPDGCVAIQKPVSSVYNSAPSTMDFFKVLGTLDSVTMTGTQAKDWSIPEIRELVESEDIAYVGKYNAPDYEYILSEEPSLAVESTMIYHCPEVKENIEKLGIPVLVDQSSRESEPLGRLEWIKLYGLLTDKSKEAEQFFKEQVDALEKETANAGKSGDERKSVAFFYVNTQGAVNVRRPGDYITRMIELAGGQYAFDESIITEGSSQSAVTIQMEAFYDAAKDADILIYNSVIDGNIDTMDQLYEKSPLFRDFKAVKNGQVYCAEQSMYQETGATCEMVLDYHRILNDEDVNESELKFIHKVK